MKEKIGDPNGGPDGFHKGFRMGPEGGPAGCPDWRGPFFVPTHLDELQHSVSILISINFGKNVPPHIFHKKNCCDLNLGESLCVFAFFLFSYSRLNLLNGLYFYFDLF